MGAPRAKPDASSSPLAALAAEIRRVDRPVGEASIADIFLGRRFEEKRPDRLARAGSWARIENSLPR
jgi:hypothetical protein